MSTTYPRTVWQSISFTSLLLMLSLISLLMLKSLKIADIFSGLLLIMVVGQLILDAMAITAFFSKDKPFSTSLWWLLAGNLATYLGFAIGSVLILILSLLLAALGDLIP